MQTTGRNHADIGTLPCIANTLRLLVVQLLVVGIIVGSLLAFQAGTASADTGAPSSSTGSPVSCDPHRDPDCARTQQSVTDWQGSGSAAEPGNPDDSRPFENHSEEDPDHSLGGGISSGQCFIIFCIPL